MNLRSFLQTLGGIAVTPWSSVMAYASRPQRVYPKGPDDLPGLWVHDTMWGQTFYIIREYDEWNDEWHGQKLDNSWRNKFWGDTGQGEELCCITMHPLPFDVDFWDRKWMYPPEIHFYSSKP